MESKKKIIISVSAFILVLLATVVAVVSVLAATSVSFSSSIKVTYTVGDIAADVAVYTAKVKTNATTINWGEATATAEFDVNGFKQGSGFTGTVASDSATASLSDISIAKDECVVLKFVFNNNSSKAFGATLTKPTGNNMNIYYTADQADLISNLSNQTANNPQSVSVVGGEDATATYYAVIKIASPTQDATFNGAFAWTLA